MTICFFEIYAIDRRRRTQNVEGVIIKLLTMSDRLEPRSWKGKKLPHEIADISVFCRGEELGNPSKVLLHNQCQSP